MTKQTYKTHKKIKKDKIQFKDLPAVVRWMAYAFYIAAFINLINLLITLAQLWVYWWGKIQW